MTTAAYYKTAAEIPQAKFGVGYRDTRWDVYPQAGPARPVAWNWQGFWAFDPRSGVWFRSPASYCVHSEIAAEDAERLAREALAVD